MKKPSLEKVMKDLENFQYELQLYCYHKLNGRDEEAQSYMDCYLEEQKQIKSELISNLDDALIEYSKDEKDEEYIEEEYIKEKDEDFEDLVIDMKSILNESKFTRPKNTVIN